MTALLTLNGLLDAHLDAHPTRTALIDGERPVSYAEFDELAEQASGWLVSQGIQAGDRVAIWLVNRIEWLALLFGAARLGATVVAVNTRYRSLEVGHILSKSRARMLILQPRFRKIEFLSELQNVPEASLAALERVAVIDAGYDAFGKTAANTAGNTDRNAGVASEVAAAGSGAADRIPATVHGKPVVSLDLTRFATDRGARAPVSPDAPLILFTTSGTTKAPKLVVHPQHTVAGHSRRAARAYGFDQPDAVMLAALPFCGVFGLNGALAAFAGAAPVVLLDTFDGPEAARLMQRHRVTHTFGSDEMYRRLAEAAPGDAPFPSARVLGFAAFQPGVSDLASRLASRGMHLTGLYGSSEVQALFSLQRLDAPLDARIEGGGYPAAAAARVRIRDIETGALLGPGQSGEIEIAAPGNFVGYFDDPEASAEALSDDGFFRTGDIGRLREDGSFVYETRKGDAIRLAGFLVSPVEIEDRIKALEGVADAQVVSVELDGQPRPVAFVIPAPGAAIDAARLTEALRPTMAAFKVPVRVWTVDAFPVTESSNGVKIQRTRLRAMALERLAAEQAVATH
ncbi:AMP-binding protein [Chitinasiproducens palmae]|uniref:Long-chain-fatty-acid--CoA ligase n=1 Tax=Chitinasiproducens palmae TaxID=1770053 RepID=A0A1H2PRE6_9BURK|nr:AMP-binding protein [Chitinasiproducens palmae]SDV49024.1 fatty-acyl-CoA synthase [Chitinasiproducens palmae]